MRHTSGWSLAAIRQTRRVAAVPLSDTAARFGVAENDLRAALAASRGRGGCAQAVAAMAVAGSAAAGCVSQCPPPAALAGGSVVAAGPVSWSSDLGGDAAVDSEVPAARGLHRRALAAAALHRGHEGRVVVASNSGCAPLMLAALAGQGHRTLQQSALAHPACPPAALAAALAVSPDEVAEPDTVTAAAANPALPAPLLVASVSRRAAAARRGAAANPSCPPRLLGVMADAPNQSVRRAAAANPSCPPYSLMAIGCLVASDPDVVGAAAANPNCDPGTIGVFAGWDRPAVRSSLLSNPSCPPELFWHLVDTDTDIDLGFAACSPHADADLLERISRTPLSQRRLAAVAEHPACGPDTLARLAGHSDGPVRAAAATNPSCPLSEVVALARDDDPGVLVAARARLRSATSPDQAGAETLSLPAETS